MKIRCPYCEKEIHLKKDDENEMWIEKGRLQGVLGKMWPIAVEYVECFRKERNGHLTFRRRIRLLGEVARLLETGLFEYDGKRYRITKDKIAESLRAVCDADVYGLANHNYLKKPMMERAVRVSAEGKTAEEERRSEEQKRQRTVPASPEGYAAASDGEGMSAEEYKRRHGIESLADSVGIDLNDPTCVRCGDPLTEAEKQLEIKHKDKLCSTCRRYKGAENS